MSSKSYLKYFPKLISEATEPGDDFSAVFTKRVIQLEAIPRFCDVSLLLSITNDPNITAFPLSFRLSDHFKYPIITSCQL